MSSNLLLPTGILSADVGRAGHDSDGYYSEEKADNGPAAGAGVADRGGFADSGAERTVANAEQNDGDDDGDEDEAAPGATEKMIEAIRASDQNEAEGDGECACIGEEANGGDGESHQSFARPLSKQGHNEKGEQCVAAHPDRRAQHMAVAYNPC